jgi:23S rRNA (cytosine1962-C5)-methyltransferase
MAYAALTLTDAQAAQVRRGHPQLELAEVRGAATAEPGQPFRLLAPDAQPCGTAVADPENELLRVYAAGVVTLDLAFLRKRVARAHARRVALGLAGEGGAGCYRLIHGEGDDLGGFTCDVFGEWGVVWALSRGLLTLGRQVAQAAREAAGLRGVVVKVRPKGGVKAGQLKQEIVGDTPPEKVTVHELGVPYEVHPLGGLNVGLFLDMREQRRGLWRFVRGRSVLNTFAYTGSLSLGAALAGASAVTSVDLSSGVLRWAQENFRLAGLDPADPRWRFETSDVMRFLKKQQEPGGARFGCIILDPPTFSAARASAWSMREDYPELIALAMDLVDEAGGFLFVASNEHRGKGVLAHVDAALARASRKARVLETGGLPPDHPTHPLLPDSRYLEIAHLWVE